MTRLSDSKSLKVIFYIFLNFFIVFEKKKTVTRLISLSPGELCSLVFLWPSDCLTLLVKRRGFIQGRSYAFWAPLNAGRTINDDFGTPFT